MGNFAENLNLGNRFRPPPPAFDSSLVLAQTCRFKSSNQVPKGHSYLKLDIILAKKFR